MTVAARPSAAERLSEWVRRRRRIILTAWLLTLILAGLSALSLAGRLSGGGWYAPGSGSLAVLDKTAHGFVGHGNSDVTLVARGPSATVAGALASIPRDPRLEVLSAGPVQVQASGTSAQTTAIRELGLRMDDGTARRVLPGLQSSLAASHPGVRLALVSSAVFFGEANILSQHDLVLAELAAMPLIVIILLLLYRSIAAAVVSFAAGVTAITWTFGLLSLFARHFEISVFAENACTMIGLGVSVDYSLFIISRYRTERTARYQAAPDAPRGSHEAAALAFALRTSGHTVLFSGVIVMAAMSALFLIDLNVIASIALAVVLVTGFAVIASLIVLPAVLLSLGHRIEWGALRRKAAPDADSRAASSPVTHDGWRWAALARAVMRRPWASLGVTVALLGALAVPTLSFRTFTPDVRILPSGSAERWGYEAIADAFGTGTPSPMLVVVPAQDRVAVVARLSQLPGVTAVARSDTPMSLSRNGQTAIVQVIVGAPASAPQTITALSRVRSVAAAYGGIVGGETAEGIDANAAINSRLPLVAAVMLTVIFLLLLLTFRSVLIPLKAIVVNGLSVAATYGILVLAFARNGGYLQNFVPALLLAVLFSLSTDYEVFLLGRVREEYLASGDNAEAVAAGLARTAPLISGAAALMVAVFGGFGLVGLMPMRQLGTGLAVAVALDATIVRLVLVPAFMQLAGRWNWWPTGHRPRVQVQPVEATLP
jgi:RND superfamily putative drug exporter